MLCIGTEPKVQHCKLIRSSRISGEPIVFRTDDKLYSVEAVNNWTNKVLEIVLAIGNNLLRLNVDFIIQLVT